MEVDVIFRFIVILECGNKKTELNELRSLLRSKTVSNDPGRKQEVVKRVIAYMTQGIDVSGLFPDMVLVWTACEARCIWGLFAERGGCSSVL